MTVFQFILASLACYRLSVLFARDEIAKPLRKLPYVGHVIGCHFCNSIYLAAGIETAFLLSGISDPPVVIGAIVFAMSAIAIALDRCFTSDYQG